MLKCKCFRAAKPNHAVVKDQKAEAEAPRFGVRETTTGWFADQPVVVGVTVYC